jgi:hypothetical protein
LPEGAQGYVCLRVTSLHSHAAMLTTLTLPSLPPGGHMMETKDGREFGAGLNPTLTYYFKTLLLSCKVNKNGGGVNGFLLKLT